MLNAPLVACSARAIKEGTICVWRLTASYRHWLNSAKRISASCFALDLASASTVSFPRVRKADWNLRFINLQSTRNSAATAVHKSWLSHWERTAFFSGDCKTQSPCTTVWQSLATSMGLVKWRHARRRAKISALWGLTSGCFMSQARSTWFGMW